MARKPEPRGGRMRPLDAAVIGSTGLNRTGGYIDEEFYSKLRGSLGRRLYREMADNDPTVGAMLFAVTMLIRNAEWRVEAADETPAAEEWAEWLGEMLLEGMSHTWADFIEEVCSMFAFGFSVHEPVWRRDGARWVIDGIPIRAQNTVERWDFDDAGNVVGLWQNVIGLPQVYIPAERLLMFRTQSHKNNPEGRSILRNSVIPYLRKKRVEEAEGQAAQRAAGIVKFEIPARFMEADASPEDRAVYQTYLALAEKLAKDQTGAVVIPSDTYPTDRGGTPVRMFDVSFITADGRRPADMGAIVARYSRDMATSILADFIFLGQQAVGSFALSSDKTALFANALKAWLGAIRQVINGRLVPAVWRVNGLAPDLMPTVEHGDVETPDVERLTAAVRNLALAGADVFPDSELENTFRRMMNVPERADDMGEGVRSPVPGDNRPLTGGDGDQGETAEGVM